MGQPPLLPGGPQMGDGPLLAQDLPEEPGAGGRGRRRLLDSCFIFFMCRHIGELVISNQ